MQYGIANILIKTSLTKCQTFREQRIVDIHDKFEASIQTWRPS